MKYSVEQLDAGVVVKLVDARSEAQHLLAAVRNCSKALQQGCSVECGKMATLEESVDGETIVVHLLPKSGEHIEASCVRRCLQALWRQADMGSTGH